MLVKMRVHARSSDAIEASGSNISRASWQDTDHSHQFDITVHYRFHPRHGERLGVVGTHSFRGERAAVIEQDDGSLSLLPIWVAAEFNIVSGPRISREALVELRHLVDAAVSSRASPVVGPHVGEDRKQP